MSLLVPDTGLLFWMALAFGVVLFVLVKFGFPVITKAVEARSAYIADSLEAARKAEDQLATLNRQAEAIMEKAQHERNAILNEAQEAKHLIVGKAKEDAEAEARRRMNKALEDIEGAKKKALADLRKDVAAISVKIAEKIIGERLKDDRQQQELINKLLAEEFAH
jgi:F-type H+-transporting ATPase subunit b